jgi:hypothetical protein
MSVNAVLATGLGACAQDLPDEWRQSVLTMVSSYQNSRLMASVHFDAQLNPNFESRVPKAEGNPKAEIRM